MNSKLVDEIYKMIETVAYNEKDELTIQRLLSGLSNESDETLQKYQKQLKPIYNIVTKANLLGYSYDIHIAVTMTKLNGVSSSYLNFFLTGGTGIIKVTDDILKANRSSFKIEMFEVIANTSDKSNFDFVLDLRDILLTEENLPRYWIESNFTSFICENINLFSKVILLNDDSWMYIIRYLRNNINKKINTIRTLPLSKLFVLSGDLTELKTILKWNCIRLGLDNGGTKTINELTTSCVELTKAIEIACYKDKVEYREAIEKFYKEKYAPLCYYIIDYMRNLMILGAKEYK
jgi:hypothetical protein